MKIPLIYGGFISLATAVLTLVLFFLGWHSDPAKIQSAGYISMALSLAISVTGITLGTRAKRNEMPPTEAFSYGRAFTTGLLIGLTAAVFSSIFQVIYVTVINSSFIDVMTQQQAAALEAKGVPTDQIEKIQKVTHIFMHPALQFIFSLFGGALFSAILSLITAAFLKRTASSPYLGTESPPLPPASPSV